LQCLRAVAGEAGEDAGTEGRRRRWMWEVKGLGDIIVKESSVSRSIEERAGDSLDITRTAEVWNSEESAKKGS